MKLEYEIFDCANQESERTFSLKRKDIEKYSKSEFKVQYINDSTCCHTLPHTEPVKAIAVLTTDRDKNNLTLSVCPDCAKAISKALKHVYFTKNKYVNKKKNITINYYEHIPDTSRCSFCGEEDGEGYDVHLADCHYYLCSACEKRQYYQFLEIHKINGIIKNIVKNNSEIHIEEVAPDSGTEPYAQYSDLLIINAGFSTRIANALKRKHIHTVADLLNTPISDIKNIRNIGATSIAEIEEYISNLS
ncbi:MAG: hypothetical protein J1E36_05995 [Eubacterium sp.]|nr:hypothetical protein [Eubacterium sp.]